MKYILIGMCLIMAIGTAVSTVYMILNIAGMFRSAKKISDLNKQVSDKEHRFGSIEGTTKQHFQQKAYEI